MSHRPYSDRKRSRSRDRWEQHRHQNRGGDREEHMPPPPPTSSSIPPTPTPPGMSFYEKIVMRAVRNDPYGLGTRVLCEEGPKALRRKVENAVSRFRGVVESSGGLYNHDSPTHRLLNVTEKEATTGVPTEEPQVKPSSLGADKRSPDAEAPAPKGTSLSDEVPTEAGKDKAVAETITISGVNDTEEMVEQDAKGQKQDQQGSVPLEGKELEEEPKQKKHPSAFLRAIKGVKSKMKKSDGAEEQPKPEGNSSGAQQQQQQLSHLLPKLQASVSTTIAPLSSPKKGQGPKEGQGDDEDDDDDEEEFGVSKAGAITIFGENRIVPAEGGGDTTGDTSVQQQRWDVAFIRNLTGNRGTIGHDQQSATEMGISAAGGDGNASLAATSLQGKNAGQMTYEEFMSIHKRAPRRGENGISAEDIKAAESLGYVMSGSRNRSVQKYLDRVQKKLHEEEAAKHRLEFLEEEDRRGAQDAVDVFASMIGQQQQQHASGGGHS